MSRRSHARPLLLFGAHVVEVPAIHRPFPIVYPVPAHTVSRDIVRLIDVIRRACAYRGRDGLSAGVALALDSYALDPCRLDVRPNRRREIRAIQRLVAFASVHRAAAHVSVRVDGRRLFLRGILQNGADNGGFARIAVPTFIDPVPPHFQTLQSKSHGAGGLFVKPHFQTAKLGVLRDRVFHVLLLKCLDFSRCV